MSPEQQAPSYGIPAILERQTMDRHKVLAPLQEQSKQICAYKNIQVTITLTSKSKVVRLWSCLSIFLNT